MYSSKRSLSASVSILGCLFLLSWSMAARDITAGNAPRIEQSGPASVCLFLDFANVVRRRCEMGIQGG